MIGNDEQKLSYEKPEVVFWPAAELDAIQAAMSGGGGGSSGGGGSYGGGSGSGGTTTYTTVTYELDHGGALFVTVSASKTMSLVITKIDNAGLMSANLKAASISGTHTYRLTMGYGFHVRVKLTYTGSATTNCSFGLSSDYANSERCGARWSPDDLGIRPVASPICRMRWYVTDFYSDDLLDVLRSALWSSITQLLCNHYTEEAIAGVIEALGCTVPEAAAMVSAFTTLMDLFGIVQMLQLNQYLEDNLFTNYVMVVNDYGDGATMNFTSNLDVESWDGQVMCGEPGYEGTFVSNTTFDAMTVYQG